MQHAAWIEQARQHWKEHRPKAFRQMVADGTLNRELRLAAERTAIEMDQAIAEGFNQYEAWEMVRERYLFPPEEPGNSPEAPPSEGYMVARDINRAMSEIGQHGNE